MSHEDKLADMTATTLLNVRKREPDPCGLYRYRTLGAAERAAACMLQLKRGGRKYIHMAANYSFVVLDYETPGTVRIVEGM